MPAASNAVPAPTAASVKVSVAARPASMVIAKPAPTVDDDTLILPAAAWSAVLALEDSADLIADSSVEASCAPFV